MLIGIRPGDDAYVTHSGTDFRAQDDTATAAENMAFYEINAAGDRIDFDLAPYILGLGTPLAVITTAWGTTEYDLIDRDNGQVVLGESSGFDTDVWMVDLSGTEGQLRLTNFADTQAAFLPYLKVWDLVD